MKYRKVWIDGVEFESMADASKHLGKKPNYIAQMNTLKGYQFVLEDGTDIVIEEGDTNFEGRSGYVITIDGIEYSSFTEATRATGIKYGKLIYYKNKIGNAFKLPTGQEVLIQKLDKPRPIRIEQEDPKRQEDLYPVTIRDAARLLDEVVSQFAKEAKPLPEWTQLGNNKMLQIDHNLLKIRNKQKNITVFRLARQIGIEERLMTRIRQNGICRKVDALKLAVALDIDPLALIKEPYSK